jgi:hypothetical protein
VVSQLKVNEIIKQSGSSITIGEDGDTVSGPFTNTPAFKVNLSSDQTISNNTWTKVQYNSEEYDTDSAYDNSSNYRFTVPSGKSGKYIFHAMLCVDDMNDQTRVGIKIYKNGSADNLTWFQDFASGGVFVTVSTSVTYNLSAGDYIEIYGRQNHGSDKPIQGAERNVFFGYRIIGA